MLRQWESETLMNHKAINPLRPNSDLSQTSHRNIKGLSVSEAGPAFGIGDIGGRLGRHLLEGRRQRQSPSAPMSTGTDEQFRLGRQNG